MSYSTSIEESIFADWCRTIERSAIQDLLVAASHPDIFSFALGLPAAELFPIEILAQIMPQVLAAVPLALQYAPASQALKTQIVTLMAQRGVTCKEEQVFLTTGAQQGMSLLTRLFLNPGGQMLLEEVTYPGFQQALMPLKPDILTIPTDPATGLSVDALELLLKQGIRPAFLYTIPDGHNPSGASIPGTSRIHLVELARRYHFPIVEDDAYGFLSYKENGALPMRALDEQWVCYLGSFSKILAPALRVGWMVVPEHLIPRLSVIKEASDIDTTTFAQRTVAAYLQAGHLPAHLELLRREYSKRRDTLISALQKHFPVGIHWSEPSNGMFLWVTFPENVDTDELLKVAIEQERVAFVPGSAFRVNTNHSSTHCMRLNFSNSDPERIEEGITRLARALGKLGV
jgi:2-aminoadipate transaminase